MNTHETTHTRMKYKLCLQTGLGKCTQSVVWRYYTVMSHFKAAYTFFLTEFPLPFTDCAHFSCCINVHLLMSDPGSLPLIWLSFFLSPPAPHLKMACSRLFHEIQQNEKANFSLIWCCHNLRFQVGRSQSCVAPPPVTPDSTWKINKNIMPCVLPSGDLACVVSKWSCNSTRSCLFGYGREVFQDYSVKTRWNCASVAASPPLGRRHVTGTGCEVWNTAPRPRWVRSVWSFNAETKIHFTRCLKYISIIYRWHGAILDNDSHMQ